MLKLVNTTKKFTGGRVITTALNNINLEIDAGEYVAVTGPSGCGKSTLLSILGMLDVPDGGEYWFDGQNIRAWPEAKLSELRRGRIGFIFQSFNLLTRATALQNVMQPLIYQGVRYAERERRARLAIGRVGLEKRANHLPNQLSGGQRQRIAIARALCSNPSILLADEPTGNLDSHTTADIMALFDELHAEGQTIILVTHEPEIAEHCQRVVRLADGKVVSDRSKGAPCTA